MLTSLAALQRVEMLGSDTHVPICIAVNSCVANTLLIIAALLAVFCLWRRSRRAPVPREQRGPYIKAQPETTAVTEESQWRDPSVAGTASKTG